jgi:hypothetical protein
VFTDNKKAMQGDFKKKQILKIEAIGQRFDLKTLEYKMYFRDILYIIKFY